MSSLLETPSDRLLAAVRQLLTDKAILTREEIAERIRSTDNASPAQGARMVARAWTDPAYRARMLADGAKAAEELDIGQELHAGGLGTRCGGVRRRVGMGNAGAHHQAEES